MTSADWFTCPVCGEEVPAGALACPECGSDDKTGWSPETEYDGLDLPQSVEEENRALRDIESREERLFERAHIVYLILVYTALIAFILYIASQYLRWF